MNKIFKIINEEISIFEAQNTNHADIRLNERLIKMTKNEDITAEEADKINKNIKDIISYQFNPNLGYGIMLGRFKINPESNLIYDDKGILYYRIMSADKDDIIKDSTGNEFWCIVRSNKIITIFLRKSAQRQFAGNERKDRGGLGVDTIIDDFQNYIATKDIEKQILRQKELEKLKNKEYQLSINGVIWQIDNDRKILYKKNKPNIIIRFDDILDYPEWDDDTKEKVFNFIA